jgi:hypothetical protein
MADASRGASTGAPIGQLMFRSLSFQAIAPSAFGS